MFALVENNQFVKTVSSSKGIELNGIQYPKTIFTLWTEAERNAIGLYEINVNSENKKDEAYYINTDITYSFNNGIVTGSYGVATPKPLDDVLFVEGDEIPSDKQVGDVKQYGLKGLEIAKIKAQAGGLLAPTDWYVIRYQEDNTKIIPTNVANYRSAVRTKSDEMESLINACGSVEDLKILFSYIINEDDGSFSRPIGEFPEEIE